MNLSTKLMNISALAASFLLLVPASVVVRHPNRCPTGSTIEFLGSCSLEPIGQFSRDAGHSSRPCPLLQLRAGLAQRFLEKDAEYMRLKEVDLLSLLEVRRLDDIFLYRSVAGQDGLKYLSLPDEINLKGRKWRIAVSRFRAN